MFVKHRRHFIIIDDISRFGETAEHQTSCKKPTPERRLIFFLFALDAHKLSKDVLLESQ